MRRAVFPVLAIALAIVLGATPDDPLTLTFRSPPDMTVKGGSTLHDWSCPVDSISGRTRIVLDGEAGALPVDSVLDATATVPVAAIQCDRETMNEKLRKALKWKAHPHVRFALDSARVSPLPDAGGGAFQVTAVGSLTVAGVTNPVQIPVTGRRQSAHTIQFSGVHTLKLSEYEVERPSAMLGTLTVSDEITVDFSVTASLPTK